MDQLQRHIVQDHILDLRREADARRAARLAHDHDTRSDDDVGSLASTDSHRASPVRVRFGHWLMGVGAAVARSDSDPIDRTAGHAA
jgi:hypothetical protein